MTKNITFMQLVGTAEQDRPQALRSAVATMLGVTVRTADSFAKMPNSPLAYWLTTQCVDILSSHAPLESFGGNAKQGLATADDFRFLRLWWETPPEAIVAFTPAEVAKSSSLIQQRSRELTKQGCTWAYFAKGGEYSPYYADITMVVNWRKEGAEIKQHVLKRYPYLNGKWQWVAKNVEFYFRSGLTWPLRTNGLSFRVMPSGCVFGHKGPALFAKDCNSLLSLLALLNTKVVEGIVHGLGVGRIEIQSYEVGTIQNIPVPPMARDLALLAEKACLTAARAKCHTEINHLFISPVAHSAEGISLQEIAHKERVRLAAAKEELDALQANVEGLVISAYGFSDADVESLKKLPGVSAAKQEAERTGTDTDEEEHTNAGTPEVAIDILSWSVGLAFGRWDVRYTMGERQHPELPDPFGPLPVCSPGMLQNAEGLPAEPKDVPADYPLRISWSGILVDDENHPEDIVNRVREVIETIWTGPHIHAEAVEQEACDILNVKTLRDYFRRPASFFADHLKRYSKSRRQAPIYWPLSTASGSYTIWIYYHRFGKDTFYRVCETVDEKLRHEERKLFSLQQDAGPNPSTKESKALDEQAKLVEELRALRTEVARVLPLWNPNLNDGVIINFAPFHRLISHPKWRKDVTDCWNELVKGSYDWSHLAMHLWPERVIPKCATDLSLAIAHGLDEAFWESDPDEEGKYRLRGDDQMRTREIEKLVSERKNPAVRAALAELQSSPTVGPARKRRKAKL